MTNGVAGFGVALVFLGLDGICVGVAGLLGLYPSRVVLVASVAATLPAITGTQ